MLQQSFVGAHFTAWMERPDAAPRPFNFKADDPVRRSHCVQYISHPTFTWQKPNRASNVYEQGISPRRSERGWMCE